MAAKSARAGGGASAGPAFLVGLRSEAAILRGAFGRDAEIVCAAARPMRARARLDDLLLRHRPSLLISFGVCGALDVDLNAGDLCLPAAVHNPQGVSRAVDATARTALLAALIAQQHRVHEGPLLGSERALCSPTEKRDAARTGALSVDMESHVLAETAAREAVPFLVLRAVADTAEDGIPEQTLTAITDDGRPRLAPILAMLARRPGMLPALIQLGRRSARAHASLRRVAPMLVATLG